MQTDQRLSSPFKQAEIQVADDELRLVRSAILKPGRALLVGRNANCGIRLKGVRVSRRHASLELKRDGLYLTDLGSSNGVFVDGERVRPNLPVLLKPTQAFQLGEYTFTFTTIGFAPRDELNEPSLLGALGDEFEIFGQLGAGSSGSVWSAYDRKLERKVAIKLLHVSASDTSALRFLREAELCQRVVSKNVVTVYEVHFSKEQPAILMELVDGPSALERLRILKPDAMGFDEVLRIGEDVAHALEAADRAGVVHRDIKPSNVLLSPTGAKLSDFGVAKHLGGASMTRPGQGLGTLVYVAPEQAESASKVDGRADLYGLGATLFHLIAGRPPFDPRQPLGTLLAQIMEQTPESLLDLRPDTPDPLAALVADLLRKDREERPSLIDVRATLFGLRRASSFDADGDDTTQD